MELCADYVIVQTTDSIVSDRLVPSASRVCVCGLAVSAVARARCRLPSDIAPITSRHVAQTRNGKTRRWTNSASARKRFAALSLELDLEVDCDDSL